MREKCITTPTHFSWNSFSCRCGNNCSKSIFVALGFSFDMILIGHVRGSFYGQFCVSTIKLEKIRKALSRLSPCPRINCIFNYASPWCFYNFKLQCLLCCKVLWFMAFHSTNQLACPRRYTSVMSDDGRLDISNLLLLVFFFTARVTCWTLFAHNVT